MTLLILSLYTGLLIMVGIRRPRNGTDGFFFASHKLGALWVGVTLTASWVGAASTLVTLQQAAEKGHAALWVMAVPTLLTLMVFFFITGFIRKHAFTTLPRLIRKVYGGWVTNAAAALIFIYLILLTSSQFVAWGQFLKGMLNLPYTSAVLGGAVLVCSYSAVGGFLAVVRTDGVQLVLLGTALIVMYLIVGQDAVESIPRGMTRFLAGAGDHGLMVFSFTLAWVISPVVWQRVAAARTTRCARLGILVAAAAVLALYLMVIPTGVALAPLASESGEVLAGLQRALPLWACSLVFLGLGSAILSTADTALNLAAMTLSLDLLNSSKSNSLPRARWGTFAAAVLSATAALRLPSILQTLGVASEIMAAGLFVPGMAALFLSRPSPRAGAFSLATGGGFALVSSLNAFGLPLSLPHWPASLPWGLGLSLMGFCCGYLCDRRCRSATKTNVFARKGNGGDGPLSGG
ncbi:MAG TPA: hypothetical protein ENN40_00695 [Candidatus Aminicenantes bacterium]|nr:hypothetical protein [Candidatus Aminicenantes bacterium]